MTAATKAPVKRTTGRKATRKPVAVAPAVNADEVRPPEEFKPVAPAKHPVYGDKKLYTYHPKDGSDPIVFPHISTCSPTALFFYENRNLDEMHQAFAWMDLCEIPTAIGRRLFLLPDAEQGKLLKEWFGGLSIAPSAEVSPPGES